MSKIGKNPIVIPDGVSVDTSGEKIVVKGAKGTVSVHKLSGVSLSTGEKEIVCSLERNTAQTRMNWGTQRALIANAIDGVIKGFSKVLEVEGVGFKSNVEGNELVLKVGFSHLVRFPIPEGIAITAEKNVITISGIDKDLVGRTAALIRSIKKPEPYLGKGIRYQGEIIRRKAGKKAGTTK